MIDWLKRHSRLAAILAATALLILAVAALLPGITQGESAMPATDQTLKVTIPQMDSSVPAVTETATFAMG